MQIRLVVAAALAAGLALTVSGAEAAPPVMDGKKVKVLTMKAVGGVASNDTETATPPMESCGPPRCTVFSFVYKPAKGVRGGLMLSLDWTNPLSDYDLYLIERDTKGRNGTEIAKCAFMGTRSAKLHVPAASLRSGRTYAMVVGHFRTVNDTANGKVELTPTSSVKTTVPSNADALLLLNCQL